VLGFTVTTFPTVSDACILQPKGNPNIQLTIAPEIEPEIEPQIVIR
jgi:hypothetical protein